MNHLSLIRRVFFVALVIFSFAAQAQTIDFILDVNNSASKTGCDVDIVSTGGTLEGIDVRVTATVDRSSKRVTKLTVSECQGGSFGLPTTLPSNTPVGIGVGVNGSDVVEMAVPLASIWQPPQSLSLFFSSFNASTGSQDLAPDTNGGTIPPGSNFSIPYSIPAVGWLGLIITALMLLIIGILALRKRHIYLAISLLSLATLGIAAGFIADGNIGDWQGVKAIVNDPSGDEVPSDASADILAVFVTVENEQLFVRFDVANLDNVAPLASDVSESVLEDGSVTIMLSGTDNDGDVLAFSIMDAPVNGSLGPVTPINDNSASVEFTPDADFNGVESFTYKASDGDLDSVTASVDITVDSVNDKPSFTAGADQMVNENAGAQTVNNWVSAFTVGPANEGTQVISFNVLNDNNALFAVQPAIDATGRLTYTPATDANGSATVTVTAMDDGGTANGGVDTSATAQFSIVVAAAPIISAINSTYDTTYLEPGSIITMNAVISDPDDATLGGISWNVVLDGNTLNSGTGQFVTTTYTVQPADLQPLIELQVTDATGNMITAPLFSEPVITCENYEALDAPVNFDFQPNLPGESIQQGDSATAYFANTTDVINARSQQVLDILVTSMATHPTTTYTMEGHTSECGTNNENIILGQARASAALAYLVSAGGDSSRFQTISYGEERPFCTESNVACWQQNSRVQIIQSGGMSSYIQPVALDDTWSFAPGYNQDIAASAGIFMDNGSGADDLGSPEASLTSFGGGSLGGAVTDHAANTSVPLAGGTLTVNADGSWSLTGQPFTPGTYTFDYRLTNAATSSDAKITLNIQVPGISWETPLPFCSLNNVTCEGPTDIDFMPVGACNNKGWTVTAKWDENADGGPLVDATAGITQSGLSFAASGSYPIGDHLLIVSATDDCGVTVTDSIPFSVVDCKAPTPVCLNGLSVDLLPVSPPSDVDGDGDLDYAAMTIWATDFIAAPINDCSGPIQYSINLLGQTPDIADTGEVFTCDNDATTLVEVHAWDQAGNSDYCETYVLVTDNGSLCTVP